MHQNLLLPLLLTPENPDALNGQMDSLMVDAHSDFKYNSEIEPNKRCCSTCSGCSLYYRLPKYAKYSYSVQKGTDLAVTNVVTQLLKSG